MKRRCLSLRLAPITIIVAVVVFSSLPAGADSERGALTTTGIVPMERTELPGGIIREKLRLPGFDPDEAVPATAHAGPWDTNDGSRSIAIPPARIRRT